MKRFTPESAPGKAEAVVTKSAPPAVTLGSAGSTDSRKLAALAASDQLPASDSAQFPSDQLAASAASAQFPSDQHAAASAAAAQASSADAGASAAEAPSLKPEVLETIKKYFGCDYLAELSLSTLQNLKSVSGYENIQSATSSSESGKKIYLEDITIQGLDKASGTAIQHAEVKFNLPLIFFTEECLRGDDGYPEKWKAYPKLAAFLQSYHIPFYNILHPEQVELKLENIDPQSIPGLEDIEKDLGEIFAGIGGVIERDKKSFKEFKSESLVVSDGDFLLSSNPLLFLVLSRYLGQSLIRLGKNVGDVKSFNDFLSREQIGPLDGFRSWHNANADLLTKLFGKELSKLNNESVKLLSKAISDLTLAAQIVKPTKDRHHFLTEYFYATRDIISREFVALAEKYSDATKAHVLNFLEIINNIVTEFKAKAPEPGEPSAATAHQDRKVTEFEAKAPKPGESLAATTHPGVPLVIGSIFHGHNRIGQMMREKAAELISHRLGAEQVYKVFEHEKNKLLEIFTKERLPEAANLLFKVACVLLVRYNWQINNSSNLPKGLWDLAEGEEQGDVVNFLKLVLNRDALFSKHLHDFMLNNLSSILDCKQYTLKNGRGKSVSVSGSDEGFNEILLETVVWALGGGFNATGDEDKEKLTEIREALDGKMQLPGGASKIRENSSLFVLMNYLSRSAEQSFGKGFLESSMPFIFNECSHRSLLAACFASKSKEGKDVISASIVMKHVISTIGEINFIAGDIVDKAIRLQSASSQMGPVQVKLSDFRSATVKKNLDVQLPQIFSDELIEKFRKDKEAGKDFSSFQIVNFSFKFWQEFLKEYDSAKSSLDLDYDKNTYTFLLNEGDEEIFAKALEKKDQSAMVSGLKRTIDSMKTSDIDSFQPKGVADFLSSLKFRSPSVSTAAAADQSKPLAATTTKVAAASASLS